MNETNTVGRLSLNESSENIQGENPAYLAWPRYEYLPSPGEIVRARQFPRAGAYKINGTELPVESGDFVVRHADGFYVVYCPEEFAKYYQSIWTAVDKRNLKNAE